MAQILVGYYIRWGHPGTYPSVAKIFCRVYTLEVPVRTEYGQNISWVQYTLGVPGSIPEYGRKISRVYTLGVLRYIHEYDQYIGTR